jgi:hypothetical protein
MVTDCDAPILTDEAVCAFCETPRMNAEIADLFGLPETHIHYAIVKLINAAKLNIYTSYGDANR